MTYPLSLAFSPCPNDTFLFYGWVHRCLPDAFPVTVTLADVQHLNQWAMEGRHVMTKLSINCLGKVLDDYILLPVGAALGWDGGPKIVSPSPTAVKDLKNKRIAIPGKDTTAYLLMQCLIDESIEPMFCTYDQVTSLIQTGAVEAGLIIHETRFTFAQQGLHEVIDLGDLWRMRTSLPIPLGGIAAKRSLGRETLKKLSFSLQESLAYARSHYDQCRPYILENSQEKDERVVRQHIDMYVNDETYHLSDTGRRAIDMLFTLARQKGLLPQVPQEWCVK